MNRETQQHTAPSPVGIARGSAFQKNVTKMYGFFYAKVGTRETAEDLTNQVFLTVTRWPAKDRSGDSIPSWLYTTAYSCPVDYWREQHRVL